MPLSESALPFLCKEKKVRYLKVGKQVQLWSENPRRTAQRCMEQFPDRVKHTVGQADNLCEGRFLFSDHWEMERTHQPVEFSEQVDWSCIPAGDEEWLFAMNRHTSLLNLAKAWLYTGQKAYAERAAFLWEDWIDRTPLTPESRNNTWRSLEAGLRCENWLRTLSLLKDSGVLTQKLLEKIGQCLHVHSEYLKEASFNFQRLSNWGVLQDHGLFLLGIAFEDTELIELAAGRLDHEIAMEIMRDGSQWEQSPMYHCEVLHCVLDTVLIAGKNQIELSGRFLDNAHRMCLALRSWMTPDGRLLCQSDSDDTDARDLLTQGALLFGDKDLKASADGMLFEENLWDFGPDADKRLKEIPMGKRPVSTALTDSGNYFLREDDTRDAAYLHMHNGCLGSGHGHADLLHIDVGRYGEDILIDSGRYTYVNSVLRRQLKEPAAHNTTRVDGQDFSVCVDSWGYSRLAQPIKGEFTFTDEADYISGWHLGYFGLPDSVLTERRVVYLKPDLFLVFDRFYAKGTHSYEQNFHLNEGSLTGSGREYCWEGKKASARFHFLTPGTEVKCSQAPYSRDYNLLAQGGLLTARRKGSGCQSMVTLIDTGRANEDIELSAQLLTVTTVRSRKIFGSNQAEAVEVVKNKKAYTVIMVYEDLVSEVDFFKAGAHEGYGKVLVFLPDREDSLCLAW